VARQFSSGDPIADDGRRQPAMGGLARRVLAAVWDSAVNLLPQACALCGQEGAEVICAHCAPALPRLGPHCPVCALPGGGDAPCAQCLRCMPAYDHTVAPFRYSYPIDRLIQALKYRGRLALAPFFAAALNDAVPRGAGGAVDIILPVPLARRRLRERGFNQALEVARSVARTRGVFVEARLLIKNRDTLAQAALPLSAREGYVRNAFRVRAPLQGRRIAVVDDVMTTGATLRVIAEALKQAGAARVENWVVARAIDR
jgi:ComF family protein